MAASQEVQPIYKLVGELLEKRQPVYGDSWKRLDLSTCFSQIPRKAEYLQVQMRNDGLSSAKAREDLLDLMNWCAFVLLKLDGNGSDPK